MRFRSGTTTAVRFRFGLAPLLCPSLRCAPWVGALPHQRSVASNVAGILSFAASVASKRIGVRNPPSTRRLPMRICKSWLLPGTEPAAGPARKPSFKQKFLPQNQRLTNNIQTRFGFYATRTPRSKSRTFLPLSSFSRRLLSAGICRVPSRPLTSFEFRSLSAPLGGKEIGFHNPRNK